MTRLFRGRGDILRGGKWGQGGEAGKVGGKRGEGSGVREAGFEDPLSTPTLFAPTDIKH